jgi:hypothetical protein
VFFYVIIILLGKKNFRLPVKTVPILPIVFFRHKRSLPISLKILDTPLPIFKGNNRLYIDYDYQQDQVSFLESLSLVMRTIIETRQANIEQRTQQVIAFHNTSSSQ